MGARLPDILAAPLTTGSAFDQATTDQPPGPTAQAVVGASLRYRVALELLMLEEPKNRDCRRRSQSLRKLLYSTSAKYNLLKRSPRARDGASAAF